MPALASAEMGHFVSKSREVIQDATDPHNRIVGFGDRHAFDAGLRGKTNLDPSPRRLRRSAVDLVEDPAFRSGHQPGLPDRFPSGFHGNRVQERPRE
jgi:hypothetical protein